MLPFLVAAALAAFAASLVLSALGLLPRAAALHVAFALGVMPLIVGAMLHFVPVLTRSRAPSRAMAALPLWALAIGAAITTGLSWPALREPALVLAPPAGVLLAGVFAAWMIGRARRTMGDPHPCIWWYVTAVAFLAAALAAIALLPWWPAHYRALRAFHLHVNLLGFVVLTAIGTLQVLMPTVAGGADPGAAARLHRDLPWAVAGAALAALGAGWLPEAAYAGAALMLFVLLRLVAAWGARFRAAILSEHGAAPSLAAAAVGLAALIAAGVGHGGARLAAADALPAFIAAFLVPLVSGAATHLLPLWRRPGAPASWLAQARARLGRRAALRAALAVGGGLLLAAGVPWGALGALAALALFAPAVLWVLATGNKPDL